MAGWLSQASFCVFIADSPAESDDPYGLEPMPDKLCLYGHAIYEVRIFTLIREVLACRGKNTLNSTSTCTFLVFMFPGSITIC